MILCVRNVSRRESEEERKGGREKEKIGRGGRSGEGKEGKRKEKGREKEGAGSVIVFTKD